MSDPKASRRFVLSRPHAQSSAPVAAGQTLVPDEPVAEAGPSEKAVDAKHRSRLVGVFIATGMGIGFSGFLVIVLAADVNSRVVAKVGISQFMVPFLFVGSLLMVSAFTGRRTFRTRLGIVGVGLLIVVPATFAVFGVWLG